MHRLFRPLTLCAALALSATAAAATPAPRTQPAPASVNAPEVQFVTTLGSFTVRLDPKRAPRTVANFLAYVRSGFYNGTIFHRVIPGFVVQGGGYTVDYREKKTRAPIKDEADNGLSNSRGTIAMARERAPDTATSQFYINLADNTSLDYKGSGRPGYAVFGRVVSGMDVVDKIANVATGPAGPFMRDAPQAPIVITKAVLTKP